MSDQKVAFVTGAARGIGLATAQTFLAEGWRVALVDIDDIELHAATGRLDAAEQALALPCDVSDPDHVGVAIEQSIAMFGRLDAVVNNAGLAVFGPIGSTTLEQWLAVMATNLTGPFVVTQAAVPHMKAVGGGSVVNIASISGLRASTLRVAYGTSKAGVIHLTKQQAAELGEFGIRVNCVAPGPVDTKLALAVHTPAIRKDYHDHIPLNRYGSEQEIANAIVWLCDDKASFVTGQTLAVDGGFDTTGIGLTSLRTDA